MKAKKSLALLITAFLAHTILIPMTPEIYEDPELGEFTVIETTTNEPAKKTAATIQDVKNMMAKTEKKLNQVKDLVESDELKGMARTISKMKKSLQKMLFKDGPGFQIVNKTAEPIWVSIVTHDMIKTNQKVFGRDQIPPYEKLTMEIKN